MASPPQDARSPTAIEAGSAPESSVAALRAIRRQARWFFVGLLVALSFFALRNLVEKIDTLANAGVVRNWTSTGSAISVLIHELQKERGMSSGFIASAGSNFGDALGKQRQQTDRAFAAVSGIFDDTGALSEADMPTPTRFSAEQQEIAWLRQKISELRLSQEYVVDRYTRIIDTLFDLQLATFGTSVESALFRQQMAFVAFMQAKEKAGQERALIAAMLSDRNFSAGRMASYHQIKAVEDASLSHFLRLASPDAVAGYQAILGQAYMGSADKIRFKVVATSLREIAHDTRQSDAQSTVQLPRPEEWFAISSQKINAMKQLEDLLSANVSASARELENRATRELAINGLLAILSVFLAWIFLTRIQRGRREAEHKLSLADAVFGNSSEAILVTDDRLAIIEVNPAFSRISGYSREEALGRHPRLLSSGRHNQAFYAELWQHLAGAGRWEGEIWNRRKNGEIYPALLSIVAVRNAKGLVTNYTGMVVELSQHKKIEALLEQLRTFDALTGLPNRQAWLSSLDQAVANARRDKGRFTILDLDLDRFKLVNDSFGHAAGDRLLVEAAERIKHALRKQDIAARLTGNRFSLLLYEISDPQAIGAVCEKLLAVFAPPFEIEKNLLQLTASIGIAQYPSDGENAATLMMSAESALYSAKDDGRNTYKYYSSDMNALGAQLLKLERLLRQALERGEFSVVYQPQVSARNGALLGVEALLRWHNPELGSVSPVQFIPVAEDTGLIVPIGEWVMRTACEQARRWQATLGVDIPVAVNLSARQFHRNDLLASVQQVLDQTGLPSRLLELEITEGLLMADPSGATDILRGLHAMGIRLALDDFGTGYSSLAYLKTFTLDRLKIDRAFVRDLPKNESDRAIAHTVIALGLNLKLEVLAEGVETAAQGDFLANAGCQVFQGYLYGKPMPAAELSQRIGRGEFRPGAPVAGR